MSTTTEKWTIFGERLKTELERQEMSLRQFAEKAGLTLTTACRYVHSQRTPRATEILKAAKVLGVTCDYMLGLSDDPHKTRDGWAKAGFHELPSAQPETHEERTETHACDCISRQAAINALTSHIMPHNNEDGTVTIGVLSKSSIKNILNKLPSAQPKPCGDMVSRNAIIQKLNTMDRYVSEELRLCDTDKKFPQNEVFIVDDVYEEIVENLPSAQPDSKELSFTHKALDTISRQDAIRIVDGIDTWQAGWRGDAIESMKALPPAQPDMSGYSDKLWQKAYERGKTEAQQRWIPCSERLPEDIRPVIVTWKNTDPASYYQYIVGKHFTGTACYKNGKWYWYSSTTEDMLSEYGRYDSEEFDEAIECIAWMPLPEPYRAERKTDGN